MNETIFFFFYNLAHTSALLDLLIIFVAYVLPYVTIAGTGIFLLFHHEVLPSKNPLREFAKKWKEIVSVFFTGLLAWILATALKYVVGAYRPAGLLPLLEKTDYSFPSGHATFFTALAFAVFFYHKKLGYFLMALAILIGIARIMAGVHFPIDILAGIAIGMFVAYMVKYLIR